MVTKKVTLAGRKRTKDLSDNISNDTHKDINNIIIKDLKKDLKKDVSNNIKEINSNNISNLLSNTMVDDVTAKKHQELKKLKSDIDKEINTIKPNKLLKSKDNSLEKKLNAINIKANINSLVRFYKRNAEAGTRFTLKYTREQQKEMLLKRIESLITEYSQYGESIGMTRLENITSCQSYADQIHGSLVNSGAQLKRLVVTDPLNKN